MDRKWRPCRILPEERPVEMALVLEGTKQRRTSSKAADDLCYTFYITSRNLKLTTSVCCGLCEPVDCRVRNYNSGVIYTLRGLSVRSDARSEDETRSLDQTKATAARITCETKANLIPSVTFHCRTTQRWLHNRGGRNSLQLPFGASR